MRPFFSALAFLAVAAIPASAAVTFSNINLGASDSLGNNVSCTGCSFLGINFSGDGWVLSADLETTTTGSGPFVSTLGTAFGVGLDNFTLECDATTCGADTITFSFDGDPADTAAKNLPYLVEVVGANDLVGNGTYTTTLSGSTPINLTGNFDTTISGTQHYGANADIFFNGTIHVSGGFDGEELTLPVDTLFNAPEPGTMGLLGVALMGLGALGFRRRKRS